MSSLRNRKKRDSILQKTYRGTENLDNKEFFNDKFPIWEAKFLRRKNAELEYDDRGLYHGPFPETRQIFGSILISENDKQLFLKHKDKFTWNKETRMMYLYQGFFRRLETHCEMYLFPWKLDCEFQFLSSKDVQLLIEGMKNGAVGIINAAGKEDQYIVMKLDEKSNNFHGYIPLTESNFVPLFRDLLVYASCCYNPNVDIKEGFPTHVPKGFTRILDLFRKEQEGKSLHSTLSSLYEKSVNYARISKFELLVHDFISDADSNN